MSYLNKNVSNGIKPSTIQKENESKIIDSIQPKGKAQYISCQLVKCWSCPEVPNEWGSCCGYILYKSSQMVQICRDNRHKIYPISFHDRVKCMLCNKDNLDPNDLGLHYHHPLTGQTDWERDYNW